MLESVYEQLFGAQRALCPVAKWIDTLADDDQDRMAKLLADPDISAAELVRVLRPYVNLSESSMRRHRARVNARQDVLTICSCR